MTEDPDLILDASVDYCFRLPSQVLINFLLFWIFNKNTKYIFNLYIDKIKQKLKQLNKTELRETILCLIGGDGKGVSRLADAFTAICNGKTDFWLSSKFDPLKVHYIDHDVVKKYPVNKFLRGKCFV